MAFELDLLRYLIVTEPIARSIECLEATDTNVADVYIFWLAIMATLREQFDKDESETSISPSLARRITAIVNQRYQQFIDEAPSDIYFVGFFLDPREFSLCSVILSKLQCQDMLGPTFSAN